MNESSHAAATVFDRFERVVDPTLYQPLPVDDFIGMTDVINSTQAIKDGRYKAVNMAGAAAITAVMNAVPDESFPFVFGGDGATLAVGPRHAADVRDALARTAAFARDELRLDLRAALIPLSVIRAAGADVRIAWFQPSPEVRYAMFSGGGLEFAEAQMKAGRFAIEAAPIGQRPDLAGLSCRYMPITSQNGVILSLIVKRPARASEAEYAGAIMEILSLLHQLDRDGHPVPAEGPPVRWSLQGFEFEARASRRRETLAWRKLKLAFIVVASWLILKTRMKVGSFDPAHYLRQTTQNTDFRKFDDGLRMTLDCSDTTADRVENRLAELRDRGLLSFGAFRQKQALVTCIVPDPMHNDHMHFVDGAEGGYAIAARRLKEAAATT
ncbi:MAG: DUF3095 domain-containing protein [Hyphomicrobiales bacterium]|nr:DUF3095 domain-containing protein [Hyphomicrobiales bacterium]